MSKALAILALLLLTSTARAERVGDSAFLRAVAIVEGAPTGQRGLRSERSPWQLMPRVWAHYPGTAEQRARRHLAWLQALLQRRGVAVVPFNLALCWNAGAARALGGRAPISSYDYARRVCAVLATLPSP